MALIATRSFLQKRSRRHSSRPIDAAISPVARENARASGWNACGEADTGEDE
jgi:hypothetical protein